MNVLVQTQYLIYLASHYFTRTTSILKQIKKKKKKEEENQNTLLFLKVYMLSAILSLVFQISVFSPRRFKKKLYGPFI